MGVRRRKGSPWFWYDFTLAGHRFRGSCETASRPDALKVEAAERARAFELIKLGAPKRLTLDAALARYVMEVARFKPSGADVGYQGRNLLAAIGKHTFLDEITDDTIAEFVARRRGMTARRKTALVSNATVNREVELLRRVLRRARVTWKAAAPEEIKWSELLLPEADERVRELAPDEEARLFSALRQDYHPLFRFALATGVRLENAIGLTWSQVSWEAGAIAFKVKSKKPGGKAVLVPITPAIAAILGAEQGKHPERVFTYICGRTRRDPHSRLLQVRGRRYPFTSNGWRTAFAQALEEGGIRDFRFHDLRHTLGGRFYRATRDLKALQRLFGHSDIRSTLRYVKVDTADIRAGLEAVDGAAWPSRQQPAASTSGRASDVDVDQPAQISSGRAEG